VPAHSRAVPPQFSYKDFFLGFKELLLEDLSGALSVSITPGVGAAGASAPRLPQVVLKLEGGPGGEAGALLRFLGEGVSLVTRREMLGVTLSPNINFTRIDVAARFVATIPLTYLPRRKLWRPDAGFRIELLHFRESNSTGAPDQVLRVLKAPSGTASSPGGLSPSGAAANRTHASPSWSERLT